MKAYNSVQNLLPIQNTSPQRQKNTFLKSNLLLIKHKLKCEPAMVIHVCKSSIWRQKTPSVRLAYDSQRVHHQHELHSPCLKTTMVAKQSLQIRTKLTDTDSQADTVGWKLLPKFRYSWVLKMPSVGRVHLRFLPQYQINWVWPHRSVVPAEEGWRQGIRVQGHC